VQCEPLCSGQIRSLYVSTNADLVKISCSHYKVYGKEKFDKYVYGREKGQPVITVSNHRCAIGKRLLFNSLLWLCLLLSPSLSLVYMLLASLR
jgi:hypothetical protein